MSVSDELKQSGADGEHTYTAHNHACLIWREHDLLMDIGVLRFQPMLREASLRLACSSFYWLGRHLLAFAPN